MKITKKSGCLIALAVFMVGGLFVFTPGGSNKPSGADSQSTASVQEVSSDSNSVSSTTQDADKPTQIVDETTYYDVFRCDWRDGILGDVTVYTANTTDFSDSYAILQPDGTFNFVINGVVYNGKISLGRETSHLYSGNSNAKVTQLLFDGKEDTTVGDVLISGYTVDGYLLIEMITTVDNKTVIATFYLWKHIDQ